MLTRTRAHLSLYCVFEHAFFAFLCLTDRDVLVDELQQRLEVVERQHQKEVSRLEQGNKQRQERMKEDIQELEKQIEDCNEMIEV